MLKYNRSSASAIMTFNARNGLVRPMTNKTPNFIF